MFLLTVGGHYATFIFFRDVVTAAACLQDWRDPRCGMVREYVIDAVVVVYAGTFDVSKDMEYKRQVRRLRGWAPHGKFCQIREGPANSDSPPLRPKVNRSELNVRT